MPLKASDLAERLNNHIKEHGDGVVMIYDGYAAIYKTFSDRDLSIMSGKRFVIECEHEDNVIIEN